MNQNYTWRIDGLFKADAQACGERITALSAEFGDGLVPSETIVDDARSAASPLHDCFEWDDAKAAEKQRKLTARKLVSHIVVRIEQQEDGAEPIRAFVHIQKDDSFGYIPTARAMSDKEMREIVLAQAWKELKSFRAKYKEYKELAKVFIVIDKAKAG